MTEKTEYITASIELLEKRDELNSDELAVLCNLKKFIYQSDYQLTFEVGGYYAFGNGVYKILEDGECMSYSLVSGEFIKCLQWYTLNGTIPATAEQIATFKRAEHFANHGRKLDEFHVGDLIEKDGELNILGNISMEEYGDVEVDGCKLTLGKLAGRYNLIQTAEELQEVEK